MRLARMAIGGLQADEQALQRMMLQDAREAAIGLAGRDREQMAAPLQLVQRLARALEQRLVKQRLATHRLERLLVAVDQRCELDLADPGHKLADRLGRATGPRYGAPRRPPAAAGRGSRT